MTIQTQKQVIQQGIANLKIVHVPSSHHAIVKILPVQLARQVLYFAAQRREHTKQHQTGGEKRFHGCSLKVGWWRLIQQHVPA